MGLFDFLFGSSESNFDTEDFRCMSEDRRHRASGSGTGHLAKIGIVVTTTTMACRVGIRMRIMLFDNDRL